MFTVYSTSNQLPHPRLGITVSRKVSPRAVVRNRIKRQVRESFRQHHGALPGVDVVVIARGHAAGSDNSALRRALDQHWGRIIGLCKKS